MECFCALETLDHLLIQIVCKWLISKCEGNLNDEEAVKYSIADECMGVFVLCFFLAG